MKRTVARSAMPVLVCLLLAGAVTTPADYVGYALLKDGEIPLPESLDDINDRQL